MFPCDISAKTKRIFTGCLSVNAELKQESIETVFVHQRCNYLLQKQIELLCFHTHPSAGNNERATNE